MSAASLPRVLTDSRGRFVFRNLPAAKTYILGASRFGYAYTRYGWTSPAGSRLIRDIAYIELSDDQWIPDVNIPLWRLGAINGRVIDENGEPMVGVAVRAFTMANIAGERQMVAGPLATTDDRGSYRISGLTPGMYVVSVLSVQSTVLTSTPEATQVRAVGELASGGTGGTSRRVATPAIDVDGRHRLVMTNFPTPPPPGGDRPRAYPAMFFPDARTAGSASPVEIGYGDNRQGIDFRLQPVSTARVSGRLDSGASAPPRLLLRLLPHASERLGFGSEAATTLVDQNGAFTFLNVPAADYILLAQASVMEFTTDSPESRLAEAPGFPGGSNSVGSMSGAPGLGYLARTGDASVWGRASLSVRDSDLDDVVVSLRPAVKVQGNIVFAEGTRPPPGTDRFIVHAEPANSDPALGVPFAITPRGDPTFPFTLHGLMAGSYLLTGLDTSTYGVASVTWDGRDVTDTGFDASLGRDFDNVVVTLTDKKIAVTGVVRLTDSRVRATVIAFPVERERWTNFGWRPARFRSVPTSSTGAYVVDSLPEGEYFFIAVNSQHGNGWLDPRFLAAAAPLAARVSVKWGDKKAQDLMLSEVTVR
jgi:hypothetical protein